MRRNHVADAHALTSRIGWPHSMADLTFLYDLGSGYVLLDRGRFIGTIMRWRFDENISSLGMVIVAEDFQGRGHARTLMNAVMSDAIVAETEQQTLFLNATEVGAPLYEKYGFAAVGILAQHHGYLSLKSDISRCSQASVEAIHPRDRIEILEADRQALGYGRSRLIQSTMSRWTGAVARSGETLVGYCLYRDFGRGRVIGPVVAQDISVAKDLILWCARQDPCGFLRLDIQKNPILSDWLTAMGLTQVSEVLTMVKGPRVQATGGFEAYAASGHAVG